jgi:predicted nucleotidyltransferase
MSTIIYNDKLSSYLFNKTSRSLLALFFGHPDESYYVNQVLLKVGGGSGAVQRELKLMNDAGLIIREKRGNMVFYRANEQSPIFNELRNIVKKTFGIVDVLRDSLKPVASGISFAFIFGSVASGIDREASDLDLMIIGEVSYDEVISGISQAEKSIQREINSVVYSISEFKQKIHADHHFIKTVLESQKIFVIGDENELARLAE